MFQFLPPIAMTKGIKEDDHDVHGHVAYWLFISGHDHPLQIHGVTLNSLFPKKLHCYSLSAPPMLPSSKYVNRVLLTYACWL
jgi:hypothetical protein